MNREINDSTKKSAPQIVKIGCAAYYFFMRLLIIDQNAFRVNGLRRLKALITGFISLFSIYFYDFYAFKGAS